MLFSSLRREQREAVGLLQIGTFLEYFDLMLYVHMAILLNDLFFPKTDTHTASLLSAFAFCSTYVLRPFGALLFGYIGDNIGRKTTVIMTTTMMAISCLIMANLPTYSQIGISAAWIVTLCRMLQGLSSMGEIIGAEIYLTEITKPPQQYPIVSLIATCSVIGGLAALGTAYLIITYGFNWRYAFWVGAGIALIGSVARTRLRESNEFADMKRRIRRAIEDSSRDGLGKAAELLKSTNPIWKERVDKKTSLAYFLISCSWPLFFYFSYIYCGNILKNKFGYTAQQVISQNLLVTLIDLISVISVAILSYKIYPLKILKCRFFLNLFFIIFLPYSLTHLSNTPESLMILQVLGLMCGLTPNPAFSIFYSHFPVLKRFSYVSFLYALTRAIMYVTTSFGLVYLTESFGYYGLLLIMIPLSMGFVWGLLYFEKLEYETRHDNPETALHRQTA